MEAAPDRFRFILERPIVGEPGAKWTYCGGATALLGRLIANGTGERCSPIAAASCSIRWVSVPANGRRGRRRAARRLGPAPVAARPPEDRPIRAGRRMWDGRQIVPPDWVKRATTPVVAIEHGRRYGYHWYIGASLAAYRRSRNAGWAASAGAVSASMSFPNSTLSWRKLRQLRQAGHATAAHQ